MRLTASDFYLYFQPDACEKRVYLRSINAPEGETTPYAQILIELGLRFEKEHLTKFDDVCNLSGKSREQRKESTKQGVRDNRKVIYQGSLSAQTTLDSTQVEIVGDPDFLIHENGSYIIRDLKLARRITKTDHPEILLQLQLYGWLFEKTFGISPAKLEVYSGAKEYITIDYDGGVNALSELERILKIKKLSDNPYSPVGWSKCGLCRFKSTCWTDAENSRDVSLVYGVDQNLARSLNADGVLTYDQLLEKFDSESLADYKRPWGSHTKRVGKGANNILKMADALKNNKEILLEHPTLPKAKNYVMFDLEGLPPQMDDLQKIYLWGTQVYGDQPGPFLAATADFGKEGDENGWKKFLKNVERIFGEHGEIPFIHWHHYEKNNIEKYIERFGDPLGIADRVLENMVDLLPIVRRTIALPLPSYSLKAVEKYVGFKRTQSEYGGDWSIAKYIKAVETENKLERNSILDEILTYNKEDLAATWAVFDWFKKKFELEKTS